ncbi:MAG: TonB-dependent receptor [Muribaculaceae bacterium]|nr:TonB-dependent receptor [Muribaculaceae bacterium]
MAQDVIVKGNVTSSDGEPIIGASVVETQKPNNGTVTDLDGNFTITVKNGSTITVSYLGYASQIVKAAASVNVVLSEDAQMMDELVVTGYTTQRKADLTGAVSVMNLKNPISESNPNMLASMQGKLAGVQIISDAAPGGGGTSIRVRGMSTINGNDPLYIIDGIPTTENLNSLNAADIESIQVLKDAASASIYGSRAANGVIIITTKKGKGDKLTVNVNYSASLQTVAKTYKMLNAQQWGEAYWTANKNAGLQPSHPFYGNGDAPQLVEYLDGATGLVKSANTDWQDAVYAPSWTNNISATITNSGKKGSMMLSANYINQDGLMDYTFYRRYSLRLNSTYNVNDYINVGENLMVAQWNDRGYGTNNDRGIPFTAMRQHPAIPVTDANGVYTNPLALCASDIANPVHELYNGRDNSNESWRIFGNAYLEVLPVKGLTLKSNIGVEHIQFFNRSLTRKIQESDVPSMSRAFGQGDTWTWTNTANYNLELGNHHLNVLAGVEAIKYRYENISAWRNQYAFEDDNYMNIDSGEGTQTNGGGKAEWALFSVFGKADYNYSDRYLASFILRRDATSRLYKENNSGIFPAVSAAWRFTEESFFPKNEVINNGKLRIGWGQNGNAAISNNYAAYSTYAYNTGNGAYDLTGSNTNTVAGIIVAASGNPDLKWETTTQTNIGLDLGFLNNSLSLSFDYYIKKTKDMLTVPPTLSVEGENAAKWMNTGDMKNRGFEVTIDYRSPEYGDFSWGANLNLAQYKNEVVKLNSLVKSEGGDYRLIEGQPMGVYYGYVVDGIFQNADEVSNHASQQGKGVGRLKYRDLDSNGVINEKDQCIIGDPNPDFTAGLNLDFRYKDFTLSAFFTGEFGFDIYNTTKRQLDFMSSGIISTNRGVSVLDAWSESNPGGSVPALSVVDNNNEMRMSTYFVEDGTYVKMKYIKLNYQLPAAICKKAHFENINFYGQVENVFTITGYSGLDPELPLGGYGARVDNGPYPAARTYTLGVNFQF